MDSNKVDVAKAGEWFAELPADDQDMVLDLLIKAQRRSERRRQLAQGKNVAPVTVVCVNCGREMLRRPDLSDDQENYPCYTFHPADGRGYVNFCRCGKPIHAGTTRVKSEEFA